MSNPVVIDAEVKKIISGDYSLLRKAEPFLTLLSRSGWVHFGKERFSDKVHFDSAEQMGAYLKDISGEYGSPQYNHLLNFVDFVSHLNLIYEDKFSLGSLKDSPFGLFVCWVATHFLFDRPYNTPYNTPYKAISMSVVDDKRKLSDIISLINAYAFEYNNERDREYTPPSHPNATSDSSSLNSLRIVMDKNDDFEYSRQLFHPSNIENKKRAVIANLFNWWKESKIKEFEWLPLQKGDVDVAKWCWDRIKAIQEKKKINLSISPSISNHASLLQNPQYLMHLLNTACGEQYQFAVYAYFCFVTEPFTRDILRNKIAEQYRTKKFKANNKGRIINVTVSDKCKAGLDRLTKHHNKKQADILSELIEKACEELPKQGRP
ncbi:TPA: hypothetical protein P2Q89_003504 [Aeromonas veronii]|nr:hypothetical protein [Aeromonas veronii]